MTGQELADAQAVLPLAVCNAVDGIASCVLPEGGNMIEKGDIFEDIVQTLRAAMVASNVGGPGDPTTLWFHWTEERRDAVREIVAQWASWCRNEAEGHAKGQVIDYTPPEAVPYWTAQAEAAERVVEAIDAGRWGPTAEGRRRGSGAMSKKAKSKRPKPEQEAEAVRDVARLMLEWAARLGARSRLARELEDEADKALRLLRERGW